jgi:hypothetical protein
MNFADLEQRVNAAVMRRLANASATLDGEAVTGIFDNAYRLQDVGEMVGATAPAFTLADADVPSDVVGCELVYGATTYTVVEPMPDGTGLTVLRLRS